METILKSGLEKIKDGTCEMKATSPMACMFCLYGHLTECHYPLLCAEACCSHYQREVEQENLQP